jgi:hypothetical protein
LDGPNATVTRRRKEEEEKVMILGNYRNAVDIYIKKGSFWK